LATTAVAMAQLFFVWSKLRHRASERSSGHSDNKGVHRVPETLDVSVGPATACLYTPAFTAQLNLVAFDRTASFLASLINVPLGTVL
jgi:hypothetical protein